tara:strand:- start:3 stop:227 length:225 start_codon:yes stop_codon:yes gene_type:complete
MDREPTKIIIDNGKDVVKYFDYNFDILSNGTIIFDEELELKDIHSQVGDLYIVMYEKGLVKLVPCDYNPAQVVE